MSSVRRPSIHWMALAVCACTNDATETNGAKPGGGDAQLVSGPLCAKCGPYAGGESSDFEGDQSVCVHYEQKRRISDEEAAALGYDMAAARAFTTREFSAPLHWVPTELLEDYSGFIPGVKPTGFATETLVSGAVRPKHLLYRSLAAAPEECAFYAENLFSWLELELDIQTADGAIETITLPGRMVLLPGVPPGGFLAQFATDLREVSGTLQLDPDQAGPYAGQLEAALALENEVVRGTLSPVIRPLGPDADEIGAWWYQPVTALWPDSCGLEMLPLDPQTTQGRAVLEHLAGARTLVNMTSPLAATWDDVRAPGRDGSNVQLGLEILEAPELLCVSRDGSATFNTQVHVWTNDGRLDWTTLMNGGLNTRDGESSNIYLRTWETFDADAAFWASNLREVDLLGSRSAQLRLRTVFGLEENDAYVDGSLAANLIPDCNLDHRCTTADSADACSAVCGTPLEVDYLYWSFFR